MGVGRGAMWGGTMRVGGGAMGGGAVGGGAMRGGTMVRRARVVWMRREAATVRERGLRVRLAAGNGVAVRGKVALWIVSCTGFTGIAGIVGTGIVGTGIVGTGIVGTGIVGTGIVGSGIVGSGIVCIAGVVGSAGVVEQAVGAEGRVRAVAGNGAVSCDLGVRARVLGHGVVFHGRVSVGQVAVVAGIEAPLLAHIRDGMEQMHMGAAALEAILRMHRAVLEAVLEGMGWEAVGVRVLPRPRLGRSLGRKPAGR
jgi:hypothetical protein